MQVNIGDKVRFLSDVGGGSVTKILDRKSVMVMNEFGFEVPSPIIELVVIEEAKSYDAPNPMASKNAEETVMEAAVLDTKEIFFPEIAEVPESGNDINVSFAFVPQGRQGNSDLNVFLINDSNYNLLYTIFLKENDGTTITGNAGVLEANTKEQTESITLANINEVPAYEFQFIFYRQGEVEIKKPEVVDLKLNPVKFYKESSYKVNDFFDENSIIMPLVTQNKLSESLAKLSTKDLKSALKEKEIKEQKPSYSSRKMDDKKTLEIDLHIHELLDDFRGLSNSEIMEVQMDHFKTTMDSAFQKGPKRLVFIHGVGNGSLKQEIRQELEKMKKRINYQDASFKEYGYGATLVQIK